MYLSNWQRKRCGELYSPTFLWEGYKTLQLHFNGFSLSIFFFKDFTVTINSKIWDHFLPYQLLSSISIWRSLSQLMTRALISYTDYGRPMKPFFTDIPNFFGPLGRSAECPLAMFSIIQLLFSQKTLLFRPNPTTVSQIWYWPK